MAEFRINRHFEPGLVSHPPEADVLAFHRRLPGYQVTPLVDLPALAQTLGVGAIQVKDESQRFGLNAFKALGAVWAMHRLGPASGRRTVTTATDGNHGRAVAWAARRLGWDAVIFIPAHAAPARVESIRREGARVELVEGTYDDAVARAAEAGRRPGWQVVADTGYPGYLDIPRWIVEGYATLFAEAREQREASGAGPPDLVVIQAGVGSLLQAAVEHFRSEERQPRLVAVEPVESDALFASIGSPDGSPVPSQGRQDSIMAGLNCGTVSLAAWPTVRRGVDLFLTIEDAWAERAMRALAAPIGGDPAIVAGESGAAGLGGLLALLHDPRLAAARAFLEISSRSRVLVVNTEGATDPAGYDRIVGDSPLAQE